MPGRSRGTTTVRWSGASTGTTTMSEPPGPSLVRAVNMPNAIFVRSGESAASAMNSPIWSETTVRSSEPSGLTSATSRPRGSTIRPPGASAACAGRQEVPQASAPIANAAPRNRRRLQPWERGHPGRPDCATTPGRPGWPRSQASSDRYPVYMIDLLLLGTSGTIPLPGRPLSALLARVGPEMILFDCGEGTQVSMRRAGWGFKHLSAICLTHLHGDHVAGLPGLLLSVANAGRTEPLDIYGPVHTSIVVAGLRVIAPRLPYEVRIHELGKANGV